MDEIFTVQRLFVRGRRKIGRNEPCPCGSGKKSKQFCLGKGIYDGGGQCHERIFHQQPFIYCHLKSSFIHSRSICKEEHVTVDTTYT